MHLTLIDEDTREAITLYGALSAQVRYPVSVTQHAVPERSSVADAVIIRPIGVAIRAIVSPRHPDGAGGQLGEAGVRQVIADLVRLSQSGITVAVQIPRHDVLTLQAITDVDEGIGTEDGVEVDIITTQVRLQQQSSVALERLQGPPTAAYAAGLSPEADTGTGTSTEVTPGRRTSIAASGVDSLTGIFR
jgi:hypothetical protein